MRQTSEVSTNWEIRTIRTLKPLISGCGRQPPFPPLFPSARARLGPRRPSEIRFPHYGPHRPLVPPPLGLLQTVEGFVQIDREDFAEWVGDGKSRGCNLVGGKYFVRICALDVDLTDTVVLGSCNREYGANRGKSRVWREDVERRNKSIFAAHQTRRRILHHPENPFRAHNVGSSRYVGRLPYSCPLRRC